MRQSKRAAATEGNASEKPPAKDTGGDGIVENPQYPVARIRAVTQAYMNAMKKGPTN